MAMVGLLRALQRLTEIMCFFFLSTSETDLLPRISEQHLSARFFLPRCLRPLPVGSRWLENGHASDPLQLRPLVTRTPL